MFPFLGKIVARLWPLVLAAWILLLAGTWWLAPAWDDVTLGGDVNFLPEDALSRRGEELFKQAFPKEYFGSSVVVIAFREGGELGEADKKFIDQVLTPALKKMPDQKTGAARAERIIGRIRAPGDKGVGALLLSRDKQAALVLVEFTPRYNDKRNWPTIAQIEELVAGLRRDARLPSGLEVALTGSATVGRDTVRAEEKSARDVEVWTIAVVVVLLLLVYRAPLVAFIPLATVYVAVQFSLNLLALLAQAEILTPASDLRVFITVLAYGAGVDYCVFLIDRYQEELDAGADAGAAAARAIGKAGGAVSASAATVICGIAMLAFAQFGKIHQAGLIIPISLIVVLVAALTFGPALFRLFGRYVFWPRGLTEAAAAGPEGGMGRRFLGGLRRRHLLPDFWTKIGPVLLGHPGLIWLTTVVIMAPFAVFAVLYYNDVNYDPLHGLPDDSPSVAGARALEKHFTSGLLGPVTVLLQNDRVDFATAKGTRLIRDLTGRLEAKKAELGIADIRSIAKPLGTTDVAKEAVSKLPLPQGVLELLIQHVLELVIRKQAVPYYVSQAAFKGHVTRMDVVLAVPPFSAEGLDDLDRLVAALQTDLPEGLQGSEFSFSGPPANVRDLRLVTREDQMRVQVLVPVVVLVLLVIVFRRPVVSVYLIVTVVFSFLATLGGTFAVFWLIEGDAFAGLDWKVPLFLFTILVAVGEDYNIFLVSRVQEEQSAHGPIQGVLRALARTGRIISTCGFIMAGTFASLLAGSFLAMKELGFALAVGVLLDTLVVRPILVPTFLLLLHKRGAGSAEHVGAPHHFHYLI